MKYFFKRKLIHFLDTNDTHKYMAGDDNSVVIFFRGNNVDSIPVIICFDEDDDPVVTFKFHKTVSLKNDTTAGIAFCNYLNVEYDNVKAYTVRAEKDVVLVHLINSYCSSEEIIDMFSFKVAEQFASLVDDAYPILLQDINS